MRCWRRLFEGLQQRISRLIVHGVSVFDDENARSAFERPEVGFTLQLAHHLHPDDVLVWTRHGHVGVLTPDQSLFVILVFTEWRERRSRDALAGRAFVARLDTDAGATVHRFCPLERKELFSDTFLATEQQRARHAAAFQQMAQPFFYV